MRALGATLAALLIALVVTWIILRLTRPELSKKLGAYLLGGALATGAGILVLISFGLFKPRELELPEPEIDPRKDLEDTANKYETDDDFEDFSADDTLDPAPPLAPLVVELQRFRAGADELLGDGDDSRD